MKSKKIKIILLSVAVLITLLAGIGAVFFLQKTTVLADGTTIDKMDIFTEQNISYINVDTLQFLMNKVYGNTITTEMNKNRLNCEYKGADLPSFYNNNESLTYYKMKMHGFEFSIDEHQKQLNASFKIKDHLASVPNDVLLVLMEKYKK